MKRFLVLSLLLSACAGPPPPPSPPPPIEGEEEYCALAHEKLVALKCSQEVVSPAGTPFQDVCLRLMKEGVNLHPKCIVDRVQACDDIDPMCTWGIK